MLRARMTLALAGSLIPWSPAQAVDPAQSLTQPHPVEKMICKTHGVTGSLVARQRRCYTKSQWKYVNEQNEYYARKVMLDNMGHPPG